MCVRDSGEIHNAYLHSFIPSRVGKAWDDNLEDGHAAWEARKSVDTKVRYPIVGKIYGKITDSFPSLARFVSMKGWKIRRTYDIIELGKGDVHLVCDYLHGRVLLSEIFAWEKFYLPPFSLKGKTVMDVGAGSGETAWFYFAHGASKVIAIEPEFKAFLFLRANATRNRWNVELFNSCFTLNHLNIPHDFMKMDCEGCESVLLAAQSLKPCIIELHPTQIGESLCAEIVEKFNLQKLESKAEGKDALWGNQKKMITSFE